MPRCSTAGKFAGYEDEMEIEVDSAEANEESVVVEITASRLCAECSEQVASTNFTIEIPFEHECPKIKDEDDPEYEEIEYEVDGFDAPEQIEEYVGWKKGRQTHLLGAQVSGTITCNLCDETIELTGEEKVEASAFEVESSH